MTTTNLIYRQLTEKDLPSVVCLEEVSFSTPWTVEQYTAVLRQGGCTVFGALNGLDLAAYVAVGVRLAIGEMEVYNIAVAERFRRLGIGKKLLHLALEAAAINGITQAILEVRVSNFAAQALYHSLGFKQVGIRTGYYHDTGEDALVLACLLAKMNA